MFRCQKWGGFSVLTALSFFILPPFGMVPIRSNPESFVGQEISLLVPIDRQTRLLACDLLLDYRSLARRINQLVPIFRFPHAPSCVYPTDVSIDCPCALPSKKRIILVAMMYL